MSYDSIYSRDNPRRRSGGWIQWKGTTVCMDVHCRCGWDGHVDAAFFYHFECPECHRKYAVGQNVKLIELSVAEVEELGDVEFQTDAPEPELFVDNGPVIQMSKEDFERFSMAVGQLKWQPSPGDGSDA